MSDQFYCNTCDLVFSSWKELKEHQMSREHKASAMDPMARLEQLLDRMVKRVKENEGKLNGSDKV